MNNGKVKAGIYYIIDPGYIFPKDDDRFLWDSNAIVFSSFHFDGFPICIWSTKEGPGCYPLYFLGQDVQNLLENIPTDSGKFVLVPKELLETSTYNMILHENNIGSLREVAYPVILDEDTWVDLTVQRNGDIGIGNYISVSSGIDPLDDSSSVQQSIITDFYTNKFKIDDHFC